MDERRMCIALLRVFRSSMPLKERKIVLKAINALGADDPWGIKDIEKGKIL
jgi:hypothetical protein